MSRKNVERWVEEVSGWTRPRNVVWCNGTRQEYADLIEVMLRDGTLVRLNGKAYPGCYLHRSDPDDVARTENLTFICTQGKEAAGPNNNWMSPADAKGKVGKLFEGSMKGRTMYVIPYLMGPPGSPSSKVGVEVTDSPYVAASMYLMTRVGSPAFEHLTSSDEFVPGLHSLGDLSPDRRFILHFPEERLIWSIGSGYGGNALLGKKCFALRIASWMAREQGWMAEHMLILGLEDPTGHKTYMAAAFPSASGKTNLAMMVSALETEGYRVWTVGDDIAWLRIDEEGRLRAVNPEAGFFGVAPGTSISTNPVAMRTIERDTIFTNVAMTSDGYPWWEGMGTPPPQGLLDWQGRSWNGSGPAAHPNSRFTAPARQCPIIDSDWENPRGVVISAIIFGSRRSTLIPLVTEALNWEHGVFMGAGMGAETTAAATGKVGVVRRDPMAMLPFCSYNMAEYFAHWLEMGRRMKHQPRIFRVNWFRKEENGKFLWPGFGENIRILKWILERLQGKAGARETFIGHLPEERAIDVHGLTISSDQMEVLTRVDRDGWEKESDEMAAFFRMFGDKLPAAIAEEHAKLRRNLKVSTLHHSRTN
ncbi:MAG: phosphoenolpyruvate carboxykinase (GTP) [Ignavibacteriales bacterium]|nr:phosphoenolpyruvate carboxykinase (GTP) [Ignavibacteriales bacterium]